MLGITKDRYLFEIEIKRSLADFHANSLKPHIATRLLGNSHEKYPRCFWYLVPYELADKVQPLLPDWAGLLRGPSPMDVQQLFAIVKAPCNRASRRLTTRECVELAHCMANQIYAQAKQLNEFRNNGRATESAAELRRKLEDKLR